MSDGALSLADRQPRVSDGALTEGVRVLAWWCSALWTSGRLSARDAVRARAESRRALRARLRGTASVKREGFSVYEGRAASPALAKVFLPPFAGGSAGTLEGLPPEAALPLLLAGAAPGVLVAVVWARLICVAYGRVIAELNRRRSSRAASRDTYS